MLPLVPAMLSVTKVLGIVSLTLDVIKTIANVCVSIAKDLGVCKENENIEDVGERSLQAEEKTGKTLKDYPSFEEYQKAINSFEIDPKINHTEVEKYTRGIDEIFRAIKVKAENLDITSVLEYVAKFGSEGFFTPTNINSILTAGTKAPELLSNIVSVLNKNQKDQNILSKTIDEMINIVKASSKLSDKDALKQIFNAQIND